MRPDVQIPDSALDLALMLNARRSGLSEKLVGLLLQIPLLILEDHNAVFAVLADRFDEGLLGIQAVSTDNIKGLGVVGHNPLEQSRSAGHLILSRALRLNIKQHHEVIAQQHCGDDATIVLDLLSIRSLDTPLQAALPLPAVAVEALVAVYDQGKHRWMKR
jgi:hypothetical protein